MPRRAFSLIEMMLVVTIAGIAAAGVTLNLMSPMRRATMEDIAGRIAAFDGITRTCAVNQDKPLIMTINVSDGSIRRGDEDRSRAAEVFELPDGFRIGRLVMGGLETTYGSTEIRFSRLGLAPTYAMLLEGRGARSGWIVVAGLTGEVSLITDEKDVADIFRTVGSRDEPH